MADFGPMQPNPLDARIRYWNTLARTFGHATESSVQILHYDDVYWVAMSGGSSSRPVWGLYAASSAHVELPLLPGETDTGTIAVFVPDTVSGANATLGHASDKTLTLFGASAAALTMGGGGWWTLISVNVRETRTMMNGTVTSRMLFAGIVSGNVTYTATLAVGETVVYAKVSDSVTQA